MKICYIANIRLPTEKGHGIQIMKMCEAFALEGHEVTLLVAKRNNPIKESAFDFYGISPEARKNISIKYLSSPNFISFGGIGFWIQSWLFGEIATWAMRKNWPDVVYSRDHVVLLNMILIHPNLVWEAHRGENNWVTKLLLKKAKLVAITKGLADLYSKYTSKTLVASDAVNLREFDLSKTKEECRKIAGLPQDKKLALYWGSLYGWKGVRTLTDAARFFGEGERAVVVGGHDKDIEMLREHNKDNSQLIIVGRRPRHEIALYMKAADVLVLPNSGKVKISSHYTSPLKLFEDMASGTPIVASDLPSLREILSEKNALFFEPDNANSLYETVRKLFEDPTMAKRLGDQALEDVQKYTWQNRAKLISQFIQP